MAVSTTTVMVRIITRAIINMVSLRLTLTSTLHLQPTPVLSAVRGLTDEQVPLNLRRHNKRRHLVLHSAALLLILLVVLLLDLDKDRVFSNILLTRATMIPAKCLVPVRLCKEVVLAPRSTACPVSKAGCLPHLNTRINRRSEDILNTVGWEM